MAGGSLPGISMRLISSLEEMTRHACTRGSLCMRWYSRDKQQVMTAPRSLLQKAVPPMKPSKPSISACMSGFGSFIPPHVHVSSYLSEQARQRTARVFAISPSLTAFQHPLARKDTIMRRNANAQQPVESVQFTGLKKLLKMEDVADILGVSKAKVYLLLRNGLPSVKIDGARRFQPDKLQAWIEQHSA